MRCTLFRSIVLMGLNKYWQYSITCYAISGRTLCHSNNLWRQRLFEWHSETKNLFSGLFCPPPFPFFGIVPITAREGGWGERSKCQKQVMLHCDNSLISAIFSVTSTLISGTSKTWAFQLFFVTTQPYSKLVIASDSTTENHCCSMGKNTSRVIVIASDSTTEKSCCSM